jgi:GAF domain-containing protein
VIGIVAAGGLLVLAGVVCLLGLAFAEWEDHRRRQDAEVASQVAALRAALRVELASRQAWLQLGQLGEEVSSWQS